MASPSSSISSLLFSTKYVFSIKGSADYQPVGQTAEGTRIDLQYQPDQAGAITTDWNEFVEDWWTSLTAKQRSSFEAELTNAGVAGAPFTGQAAYKAITTFRKRTEADLKNKDITPPQWAAFKQIVARLEKGTLYDLPYFGLEGSIVSGSDWILLRNDGVAEFSGRFTLRSDDGDHGLINATFTGIVDVFVPDGAKVREETFSKPQPPANHKLPLLLTATFDAAGAAPNWAPDRLRDQAAAFWKYQRLTEGQFLAVGHATLAPGEGYRILGVDLRVYEVRPK